MMDSFEQPEVQHAVSVEAPLGLISQSGACRALDFEPEPVLHVDRCRVAERSQDILAGTFERQVDVLRGPCAIAEAKLESKSPFECPPVGSCPQEAHQETIEGDRLAQAHQGHTCLETLGPQPVLEGAPKRSAALA
jgi:hypothetical protein